MFTRPSLPRPTPTAAPEAAGTGSSPAPPRVAGHTVVREIARGGMGRIHEAIEHGRGSRVALKVLELEGRSARERRRLERRFRAEVDITRAMAGSGVPAVLAVGRTEDGRPFFAMPLLEGTTLERALDGSLTLDRALGVLDDVCTILARAHRQGIVHRDLKPENVFLATNGETFLIDWGLSLDSSRVERRTEPVGSPEGTLGFMPPEQVEGDRSRQDGRSDVYGLGALLYTILAGRKPFVTAGSDSGRLLWRVRNEDPEPLVHRSSLRRELAAVSARAMARDPEERHAEATAFQAELERIRSRGQPLRRSRRWLGRACGTRGGRLAMGLAVGALLAGILVLCLEGTHGAGADSPNGVASAPGGPSPREMRPPAPPEAQRLWMQAFELGPPRAVGAASSPPEIPRRILLGRTPSAKGAQEGCGSTTATFHLMLREARLEVRARPHVALCVAL